MVFEKFISVKGRVEFHSKWLTYIRYDLTYLFAKNDFVITFSYIIIIIIIASTMMDIKS